MVTVRWSGAIQCCGKPELSGVKPRHGRVESGFVKYGYRYAVSRIVASRYGIVNRGLVQAQSRFVVYGAGEVKCCDAMRGLCLVSRRIVPASRRVARKVLSRLSNVGSREVR